MPISLLFFNAACGQPESPEITKKQSYIEPEFEYFVSIFELEQNVNVDIEMKFAKLEYPSVGMCYYHQYQDGTREFVNIEIDPDYWQSTSETRKEVLLFHELGHCVLGRDHDEQRIYYTVPKSIMYPYLFEQAYQTHRSYYVEELQNQKILFTDYL